MPRDQCRSCLSGCVHLLSEHVYPCVFICIPELACGWIIHTVKGLHWDGTHFENTYIHLHLFVTCLSVFTAQIPTVGLRGTFPNCLKHTIRHHGHTASFAHPTEREIVSLPEASNNPSMKRTKGGADEKNLIPAVTRLRLRICCSRQEAFSIFNSATCKPLTAGHQWHYIVSQLCLLCLPQWVLVINVVVCFMKGPQGRGGGHV